MAQPDDRTLLTRVGAAAAGIGDLGAGRPRLRAAIQFGLPVLIFGFLVVFVLRQWNQLPDFDWRFEPGWLALAVVAVFGFYFIQCQAWLVIMGWLGGPVDSRAGRSAWGKSILARYVPTNVLMLVGRIVMAERMGVSKRITFASVMYELGLGLGTALIVGAYFVIDLPDLEGQPARFAILLVIPIVLAVLHPRVFGPLANFVLRKLGREALPSTLPFGRILVLCLLYVFSWAVIGLGVFAFGAALQPLDVSDLPYVAAAYPVAFCVAVLTFIVPSGLGTRDAALATAMSAVLPIEVATAIAVAFRIFQTLIELMYVGGVVALGRDA